MSGISSDAAGSILQAGLQQNAASNIQDNEHNRAVNTERRAAQKADQRGDDVVGEDADMTVNTEGGGGGQGRNFSEAPNEENAEASGNATDTDQSGITTDDNGQLHIDVEA
jgi:hypothetical protein